MLPIPAIKSGSSPSVGAAAPSAPDDAAVRPATPRDDVLQGLPARSPPPKVQPNRADVINGLGTDGMNLLHRYAMAGDVGKLKALVDRGGDLGVMTQDGYSIAHLAIIESKPEVLKYLATDAGPLGRELLARHRQVDDPTDRLNGMAPIHMAAYVRSLDCLKAVIDGGAPQEAEITAGPFVGSSAAHITAPLVALNKSPPGMLECFNKDALSLQGSKGHVAGLTPLAIFVAEAGNPRRGPGSQSSIDQAVRIFRTKEVDPNQVVTGCAAAGLAPIHGVAQTDRPGSVRVLHQLGANLNLHVGPGGNWAGFAPMHVAVDWGRVQIIDELARCKANINLPMSDDSADVAGITPLQYACIVRDPCAVAALVANGADVHAVAKTGNMMGVTPAYACAFNGDVEGLKALVSKVKSSRSATQAILNQPNRKGEEDGGTPAVIAAVNGDVGVLQFLADHRADLTATLKSGPSKGLRPIFFAKDAATVEFFRKNCGEEELYKPSQGTGPAGQWTPFLSALQRDCLEAAEALWPAGLATPGPGKKAMDVWDRIFQLLPETSIDLVKRLLDRDDASVGTMSSRRVENVMRHALDSRIQRQASNDTGAAAHAAASAAPAPALEPAPIAAAAEFPPSPTVADTPVEHRRPAASAERAPADAAPAAKAPLDLAAWFNVMNRKSVKRRTFERFMKKCDWQINKQSPGNGSHVNWIHLPTQQKVTVPANRDDVARELVWQVFEAMGYVRH